MRVALTGASGFVGRHVLERLRSERGVEVVATSKSRPEPDWPPSDVEYVQLDMAASPADAHARLGRPDAVIHLAWAGLPNYRSLHHFESELPRQYAFLRGLVDSGLRSLVVTGTCYEYGMVDGELAESTITRPANPYGFAKDSLRRQLQFLKTKRDFGLTWARLFYMHGAGQAATSLMPQLAAAVDRGDASFGMSGGEQLRDYLPVDTVARTLVDLALRCPDAGVVNVCSGHPISVRKLVERWLAANRATIRLELGTHPYPEYEPMAFWGCAKKLRALEPQLRLAARESIAGT